MAKFFNLIKNEYIKIFSRVSTYILCSLVISALILLNLLMGFISVDGTWSMSEDDTLDMYQSQMEYASQENDKSHYDYYKLLYDNKIWNATWQMDAADMFLELRLSGASAYDPQPALLRSLISENNYADYYRLLLSQTDTSDPVDAVVAEDYNYRIEHQLPKDGSEKSELLASLTVERSRVAQLKAYGGQSLALDEAERSLSLAQYRFDHDVFEALVLDKGKVSQESPLWSLVITMQTFLPAVYLFLIIIGGMLMADEYAHGTAKLLLINPVKRSKIFLSKYFSLLSLCVISVSVVFCLNLISSLLFIPKGFTASFIFLSGGVVHAIPALLYTAALYMVSLLSIVVIVTMAFMFSCIAKNSSVSITIGLASALSGITFVSLLHALTKFDFLRYTLFANLDLSSIALGQSDYFDHSLLFAVCVIAVHMVIFLLTAWDAFLRRDIK